MQSQYILNIKTAIIKILYPEVAHWSRFRVHVKANVMMIHSYPNSERKQLHHQELYVYCKSRSGAEKNREALLKILGKHFDVTLKE